MKRTILATLMSVAMLSAFAQQDTTKAKAQSQHLNEFGVDATSFLKQFFNFNTSGNFPSYYTPTYYLVYRHHFGCGNLRIGAGADFNDYTIPSDIPNDVNKYYYVSNSLNAFIGWEFFTNLSKHWQVFYGGDFRTSMSNYKNDFEYTSDYYATGSQTQSQIYGIAPFLGFRYKFSKRLSVLTETSYAANWEQDINKTYYTVLPGASSPAPDGTNQKNTKLYSSFTAPVSLFIDFTF